MAVGFAGLDRTGATASDAADTIVVLRALGLGERCEARLPNRTLSGVAEGMDLDGALRLRLDDGAIERITAGDVFFGEA